MKKILCLIDTLGAGGAERQMVGLAVLLKQRGYHTDLVTYHPHDFYAELARKQGIGTLTLRVKDSQWSKFNAVRKHIKKNGGYDCIITYKGGPNIIGCLLKMMGLRSKVIVSERITDTAVVGMYKKTKFNLYRFADYVVPNAYSQAEFLSKNFPWMAKKIVTISNFTDTDSFCPAEVLQHEGIRILTTARISYQKNVLRYLDAISLFREKAKGMNVHFDWYGNEQHGEDVYVAAVKKKVVDLRLEDTITFYPATNDIAEKYQQCDIYCLPTNFEGYPNVVCEAMSCGKPVVCSRVSDIPVIVRENENGLMFDPSDTNDIAEKLLQMVKMPKAQLDEFGRRGREIAMVQFSRDAFVEKYIKLIESK